MIAALLLVLSQVATQSAATGVLLRVVPVTAGQRYIDRTSAAVTADNSAWVAWYQSPGRIVGMRMDGEERLDPSEGVYCMLVDSAGRLVVAPKQLAVPKSLSATQCWGEDPRLYEVSASPDGVGVLLLLVRTAAGYGSGYTSDLDGPDYVHSVGQVVDSVRVVAVGRDGTVRSLTIPKALGGWHPGVALDHRWISWDRAGRLHVVIGRFRHVGDAGLEVLHAVILLSPDTIRLVGLDSVLVPFKATPSPRRQHDYSMWAGGLGDRTAIAFLDGDTLLVAALRQGDDSHPHDGHRDSLLLLRLDARTFGVIDSSIGPAQGIAGANHDTVGPWRALLHATDAGFIFCCNSRERYSSFLLDHTGRPIPGARSPVRFSEDAGGLPPLLQLVELPWAGLRRGESKVIWYGLEADGRISKSVASGMIPDRQP